MHQQPFDPHVFLKTDVTGSQAREKHKNHTGCHFLTAHRANCLAFVAASRTASSPQCIADRTSPHITTSRALLVWCRPCYTKKKKKKKKERKKKVQFILTSRPMHATLKSLSPPTTLKQMNEFTVLSGAVSSLCG